jgi:flagellar hook assembly protein FlgD
MYNEDSEPDNELVMNSDFFISSFGVDADNELYICSFDGNIYQFTSTTDVSEEPNTPEFFALHNNFPNPFNASTTITFELFTQEKVNLKILNSAGQTVKTLLEGAYSTGVYRAVWDGTDANGLAAGTGIYHYQLNVQRKSVSGRMLLVR